MPTAKPPRTKPATQTALNATPRAWAGTNLSAHTTLELQIALACLTDLPAAHRPFWSLARVAYLQVRAELNRRTAYAY